MVAKISTLAKLSFAITAENMEDIYEEFGHIFLDSYDKIVAGTLDEKERKYFQEIYI